MRLHIHAELMGCITSNERLFAGDNNQWDFGIFLPCGGDQNILCEGERFI